MEYGKFIKLCKLNQSELKAYVTKRLIYAGYTPIIEDGYVYAKGAQADVLLTAHLDTVHKERVSEVVIDGAKISSPQGIGGDDRCGVFIILRIISETKLRPSILFCEDEEIGGVGSLRFSESEYVTDLEKLKFLIEIDRRGDCDAVFYTCDNQEFKKYVTEVTGFTETWGTFSDICNLSPICGVASVNLSCGYHHEHSKEEYVNYDEMMKAKRAVVKLIKASVKANAYEYIEEMYVSGGYDYGIIGGHLW